MIEVGTREVKTVYWIKVGEGETNLKTNLEALKEDKGFEKSKDPMKLTLNCESIGSKRD